MHRIPYIIAVGALVLLLHTLFPPRIISPTETSFHHRIDRAAILGDDFYTQYLSADGYVVDSSLREQAKTFQKLSLDWDLFIAESIAILSATALLSAGVTLIPQSNTNKSEQDVTPNA
jgi:hypothetical protein